MNQKHKFSAKMVVVFGGLFIATVIIASLFNLPPHITDELRGTDAPFILPTPYELQEGLVAAGYDIEVDGVIGKQTVTAWNKYSCDKMASVHNHYYEESRNETNPTNTR